MAFDYSRLVEYLRKGNLVAVTGAGVSLEYIDPDSKTKFPGLLTGAKLTELLANSRSYIQKDMSLQQACFLYKKRESRGDLETFLATNLVKRGVPAPPAQRLLANLPFAAYITTNVDTFLEDALRDIKRTPHPIIEDHDIPRLRPGSVPVIKIHGCVTRPKTMIFCSDEYQPLEYRLPIIDALLKVNLAQKAALYIGYSLTDYDFTQLIDRLKRELQDYAPTGYAVVRSATEYETTYWHLNGIEIVQDDATAFLRGLAKSSAESTIPAIYHPGEDWISNTYFQSLRNIATLPSETQVIDAFLSALLVDVQAPGFLVADIIGRADKARSGLMAARQNFSAFDRIASEIIDKLAKAPTKEEAEASLKDLVSERDEIGKQFEKKGRTLVSQSDSILTFSQSVRVLQVLKGAPRSVQSTCQIFIAECRPKSPSAFRDALAFSEAMLDSDYEITVVPDVAIGSLFEKKQITKVFLGAHNVFTQSGDYIGFVNTCGSVLIADSAFKHSIPVYIIADTLKITDLPAGAATPLVSTTQEEPLFESIAARIADISSRGKLLKTLNIGYDHCAILANMVFVDER